MSMEPRKVNVGRGEENHRSQAEQQHAKFNWRVFMQQYGTITAFIILCAIFTAFTDSFLTFNNIVTVMKQISMIAIVASGLTFVVVAGEIDLSIGSIAGLMGMLVAGALSSGIHTIWSVVITLAVGTAAGFINGLSVAYIGVPSFIATLASGTIALGLNYMYSGGKPIYENIAAGFLWLGQGYVGPVPVPVILMGVVLVIAHTILNQTRFGRHVCAIGGNAEAARLCGVNVKGVKALAFTLAGFAAAFSGIVMTSRLASGQPLAGEGLLTDALAAVFVGATVLKEGEAHILGTFFGALMIGVISNGLILINATYYLQNVAKGVVILLAVTITSVQQSRR